jgi:hypothetical protein
MIGGSSAFGRLKLTKEPKESNGYQHLKVMLDRLLTTNQGVSFTNVNIREVLSGIVSE